MEPYTLYDTTTGEIICDGVAQAETFGVLTFLRPGSAIWVGQRLSAEQWRFEAGQPVPKGG